MIEEATRLQLAEDVTFQSVGNGQTVVLSLASGYLYTCNETSAGFLAGVDGRRTVGQIVDQLQAEYDVPREKLLADMLGLAAQFIEEKLLVVVKGSPQGRRADA
jgi:hypothetical protein